MTHAASIRIMLFVIGVLSMLAGAYEPEKDVKQTELIRWSSDEPLIGSGVESTDQGVKIRIKSQDLPVLIPWFDVKELAQPDPQYREFSQIALDAWRAHSRFARGRQMLISQRTLI